jgi:hyperosmotically inducible protein
MSIAIRPFLFTFAALLACGLPLPIAGAEPTRTALSDARAEARIETTHRLNPYLRSDRIDVEVKDGIATLTGRVPERVRKELATAIARGIEGVREVRNELIIEPSAEADRQHRFDEVLDDGTITAAIESKLTWSRYANDLKVIVATREGGVTLTGLARSADARAAANRLAATTRGVGAVDDRIVVGADMGTRNASGAPPEGSLVSDTWITTKVKYTLLFSSEVAGSDIEVSTEAGVVTLRGELHSGIERALAIELAQNIAGVSQVNADGLTADPVVTRTAARD